MSNIPYPFIPIPRILFKNGFLDRKKKNFEKRLRFVTIAFSKCYAVPRVIDGISYEAFEFSCTYDEIAEELGATYKEVRCLFDLCIDSQFMIKKPNRTANRENFYQWDVNAFVCEKVVILNDGISNSDEKRADQNLTENSVHNSQKGQTVYREENDKKGQTKNDTNFDLKNEEKGRSDEKRADQRADQLPSVNDEKRADQVHPSLRTKESLCLKETNINKEKVAIPNDGQDLSLSHEEKDFFVSAKENELAEHQKALEAYISYRDIPNITSKTITRWLMNYHIDEVKEALCMLLSNGKTRIENPGGWIESALQKGIVQQERRKRQNIQFAYQMQSKNKNLIINSRYCKDKRFRDREFYYHIDPQVFQSELRKCL